MATNDIKSNLLTTSIAFAAITTDTTTDLASVDGADCEQGLMFSFNPIAYTDGTYIISFEESETGAFAGEEQAVAADKIIGDTALLTITAAVALSGTISTFGIFSNQRFVRPVIVSTSTTTGAQIVVNAIEKCEILPV